jgi:hypothetical protein
MKIFLITFIITAFIVACFFWEIGSFSSDYELVPNILTFLFFSLFLSLLIVAFVKLFKFIKKTIRKGIPSEADAEESGNASKGVFISFIILLVVLVPEAAFYFIGGALFFLPKTITEPFLLSMIFSFPFLTLNFIFFIFNKGGTRRGLKYGFLFFLIFFIILFGINLYIFFNNREIYYSAHEIEMLNEASPFDDSVCYKLKDAWNRDNCFLNRAIANKDVSLCNKIEDLNERYSCLSSPLFK